MNIKNLLPKKKLAACLSQRIAAIRLPQNLPDCVETISDFLGTHDITEFWCSLVKLSNQLTDFKMPAARSKKGI